MDAGKLSAALRYVDSWIAFNFQNARIPALGIALQHGDTLIYSRAFGLADAAQGIDLTTNHTFRIASHSKTFTAVSILQLRDADKLRLDDKVSMYLPWFHSEADERIATITIRQLLNHTAGVIRDGKDADFWQTLRDFPDGAELQTYLKQSTLFYDTDELFKYSNFGYAYLGLLIEAVAGTPYRQYVSDHIVKPLELASTGSDIDPRAEETLARGYGVELFNQTRKLFGHIDTRALSSATGFYATAEDVCRYFAAHFHGNETLLSDASKREMRHGYWHPVGSKHRYGLGMVSYEKKGWTLFGHSGGFPGYITESRFDPTRQLVVTVLTNASDGPAEKIIGALINILDAFQQGDDGTGDESAELERFAGTYYSSWGATDIVVVGGKLFAINPSNWAEFEDAEELTPLDDKTLKIEKARGFGSPGQEVHYHFDGDGRVESIRHAGTTMYPFEKAKDLALF